MTIKTYNQPPYYDDFDESKGFMRILFRPGHAVQARELTQMQTAIQAQIDRFGQHFFKEGSRVMGGLPTVDTKYEYVKLSDDNSNYANFNGKLIRGTDSGVEAIVVDYAPPSSGEPPTLFVRYTKTGTNGSAQKFEPSEPITSPESAPVYNATVASPLDCVGLGTKVFVDEGVYFVSGNFVFTPAQSIIVSKYSATPSARIAFQVTETVITSAEDPSLNDNATGSPNASAPGSHRYAISLDLILQDDDVDARDVDDIISLVSLKSGIIQTAVRGSDYGEIMKVLATRTFEESGNYTVDAFQIHIKDHELDAEKLTVSLEPSVAYVNGYRIETIASTEIDLDRARETEFFNGGVLQATFGNYIELNNVSGIPKTDYTTLDLRAANNALLGTARVRSFRRISASTYRLYLFDISLGGNAFSDVENLYQAGSPPFSADLIIPGTIYDTGNNSVVYKLPFDTIQSLKDGNNIETSYDAKKIIVSGPISANEITTSTGDAATMSYISIDPSDYIVTAVNNGEIITVDNVTLGGTNSDQVTLTFNAAFEGRDIIVYGPIRKRINQKTKTRVTKPDLVLSGFNTVRGGYDTLGTYSDVVQINSITHSSVGDVTERYTLDSGTRDNFYALSRIRLNPSAVAPAGGTLTISFDYFSHTTGDYFSVDSYTSTQYKDIPIHTGSDGTYSLADTLDFRPRQTGPNTFDTSDMVDPVSVMAVDMHYYLPRKDLLYVNQAGEFQIAKGISDTNPQYPEAPADSMVLYKLDMGPYTFEASDVSPNLVDNRRYTMRDIGKIDKRVQTLEYYTTLSLLERETSSAQTMDANGERYKNGFIVDSFFGHGVGDAANPDYRGAVDKEGGLFRPHFEQDNVRMVKASTGNSGITQSEDIVTLPWTDVIYEKQPYASRVENLNPYYVVNYTGNMTLSPDSDEWMDTKTRPDIVIDNSGMYDAIKHMAEESGVLGTEWNGWETNWSGTQVQSSTSVGGWKSRFFSKKRGITQTTVATTTTLQTQKGKRTTLSPETVRQDMGDKVVDINFVPYIRSRRVYFQADLLKPNTNLRMFFDGKDITSYCRQEGMVKHHNIFTNRFFRGRTGHPAGATILQSDADGICEGSFIIPNNSTLKFRTGTRTVRLIDRSDNDIDEAKTYAEATYEAKGLQKTMQGTVVSTKVPRFDVQEVSQRRVVTQRSVKVKKWTQWKIDPLAQTFNVDMEGGMFVTKLEVFFKTKSNRSPLIVQIRTVENGYPTSVVVPYGEVTMRARDPRIKVSADATVATEIVFPAPVYLQDKTEYCFVLKAHDTGYEAWTSELGGFDVTNVNLRITDQPHAGVLFKSANDSTWTAEQFKDLKFNMYRAKFDLGVPGILKLRNAEIDTEELKPNAFMSYAGENIIRVSHYNHGFFKDNSKVTISGFPAGTYNGIQHSSLNKTHDVFDVEMDSYTIRTGVDLADATGTFGSAGNVYATQNILANIIKPIAQQTVLYETDIKWNANMITGQALNGNGTPYGTTPDFDIMLNNNHDLGSLFCISGPSNYLNQPSLFMSATMTTTVDNLSPVISLGGSSVITVANRVDNPSQVDQTGYNVYADAPDGTVRYVPETSARGSSGLSRYITRRISLNDAADDLKIYVGANKPSGSDLKVYYRVETDDTIQLADIDWTLVTPDKIIPYNEDPETFSETSYTLDDIGPYKAFAVKIVLTAQNSSNVPKIKDFRAIALSN